MENNKHNNTPNNEDSWKELLTEILRLTLKLIWKIILRLTRITIKGAKWALDCIRKATQRFIEWWNDNDTQVKVRIIRIKTKAALRNICEWIVWGAKETGKFIVLKCKRTAAAIVELKPTAIYLKNASVAAFSTSIKWAKAAYAKAKAQNARRKVRYRQFRKTPGFKGLFADIGNMLKSTIDNYLEEEQTEFTKESHDQSTHTTDNEKVANKIGNILMTSVKGIVEDE